MKTNDIKKGMIVELRNGWFGIMADNMKGNTRMVDVNGLYREIGSVYSHDIIKVWDTKLELGSDIGTVNGNHPFNFYAQHSIEHNKKQLDLKQMVSNY